MSGVDEATYDVIVIGAGVSGLAAASVLSQKKGRKVLVLEARGRIGGRIDSRIIGEGDDGVDMGASFIHGPHDNPIYELAEQIGIPHSPMQISGGDPDASVGYDADGQIPKATMEKVTENVFATFFGTAKEHAAKEDSPSSSSLGSYLFNEQSPLFDGLSDPRDRLRASTLAQEMTGWTSGELDDVSLKWWGAGNETAGGDLLVKQGRYRMIPDHLATQCKEIRTGFTVESIEWQQESGRVKVTASTSDGAKHQFRAARALCSVPLGVLKARSITFNPPLPRRKQDAIDRLGFGKFAKIVLSYERAWWVHADVSRTYMLLPTLDDPKAFHPPGTPDHLPARGTWALNLQAMYGIPRLVLVFGAEVAGRVEQLPQDVAISWADTVVKAHLAADRFSSVSMPSPLPGSSLVTKWHSDPHALGAYTYIAKGDERCSPLSMLEIAQPLWRGRLGFAGEHTHMERYASVHGAYETGVREGKRLEGEFLQEEEQK